MVHFDNGSLKQGTIIANKFRIDRLLGQGGMGEVYEATHIDIGRRVAIKRLHPEYVGKETLVERFFLEAQAAGSIGHDNICQVEDVGMADGAPYLVMPLLKGETLADVLEKEGPLPLARAVDIACQVLSALDTTHNHSELSIVHRDLKPDNLFLTIVGKQSDFVKILDFGVAKVRELKASSRTRQGRKKKIETHVPMGTGPYMAPEQARALPDIDHRVDIYAMGVILYEMLTGSRPFEGKDFEETIEKIQSDPFLAPRSINPNIPLKVDRVILKAMSRDRGDRYAGAAEMRCALERAYAESQEADCNGKEDNVRTATGTTHVSSGSSCDGKISKTLIRRRRLPVKIAYLLLLFITVIAVVLVYLQNEDADVERAAPSPPPDTMPVGDPAPTPRQPKEAQKEPHAPAEPISLGAQGQVPAGVKEEETQEKREIERLSSKKRRGRPEKSPDTLKIPRDPQPETTVEETRYKETGRGGSLFLAPGE